MGGHQSTPVDSEKNKRKLKNYKALTKDVIQTVVDLLKAHDSLYSTALLLKGRLEASIEKAGQDSADEAKDLEKCNRAALQLITVAEDTVLNRKETTHQSLKKFLQFMTETIKDDIEYVPGDFSESELQKYFEKAQVHPSQKERSEKLSENERLKKEVKNLKENITILKSKRESDNSEKQRSAENYKLLEETFTTQVLKMTQQVNELGMKIEKEKRQLDKFNSTMKMKLHKRSDDRKQGEYEFETLQNSNGNINTSLTECEMDTGQIIFKNDLAGQESIESEAAIYEQTTYERVDEQTQSMGNVKISLEEKGYDFIEKTELQKTNQQSSEIAVAEIDLTQQISQTKHHCQFEAPTIKNSELKEALTQKEEEMGTCHKRLKCLGEAIINTSSGITTLLRKTQNFEEEKNNQLKSALKRIQGEKKTQEEEYKSVINDKEKEKTQMNEDLKKLEQDKAQQQSKLEENEKKYQDKISKLNVKIEEVTEQKTSLQTRNTYLDEAIKQKQLEIEKEQQEGFKVLKDNMTTILHDYRKESENKTTDNNKIRDEMKTQEEDYKSATNDKEKEICQMNEELKKLEKENARQQSELEENEKKYKKEIRKLNVKIEEVNEQNTSLQTRNTHFDEAIKQKQLEIEKEQQEGFKDLKDNMTTILHDYRIESENKTTEKNKIRDEMKTQEEDYKSAMNDKEKEICQMNEELKKLEKEKAQRQSELGENEKKYKEEIRKLNVKIEEVNEQNTSLQTRNTHLDEAIKQKQLEIEKEQQEGFKDVKDNMTTILHDYRIESENKTKENIKIRDEMKTQEENYKSAINNKEKEICQMNEELKKLKVEKAHQQSKLEDNEKNYKAEISKVYFELKQKEKEAGIVTQLNAALKTKNTNLEETVKQKQEEIVKEKTAYEDLKDYNQKMLTKFKDKNNIELKKMQDKLRSQESELNRVIKDGEEKLHNMKEELQNVINEKTHLLSKLSEKEKTHTDVLENMKTELELKKSKIEEKIRLNKNANDRINELEQKEKCLNLQLLELQNTFECKYKAQEEENERVERQREMLRNELNTKIKAANAEIESLRHNVQEKDKQIQEGKKQCVDVEKEFTNIITRMKDDHSKYRSTQENMVQKLEEKLLGSYRSNEHLKENVSDHENCILRLQQDLSKVNERLENVNDDLKKRTKVNETLEKELERIRSRKIIQVQLYSQSAFGHLSSVEDELKCVLKSKMDVEEGVDVDIINCAKASDIQTDIPLLILCIQISRLGTAVTSTVQGLTLTPKMALLILHHKDEHALPNQASERVLTGQELRNLGGIFDLAFLSGKGIYPCEMNKTNFVSLVNFIKREGRKRLREDL